MNDEQFHDYPAPEHKSSRTQVRLIAAGVADGDVNEFVPQWRVRTKFFWAQRFPAAVPRVAPSTTPKARRP